MQKQLNTTECKCGFGRIINDSQFSILERAHKDVVLLYGHVFVAVGGDDLVAQKQEKVRKRSHEAVLRQ